MLGSVELGWKFHGRRSCFLLNLQLTGQICTLLLDCVLRHREMMVLENAAALQGLLIYMHLIDDRHRKSRSCRWSHATIAAVRIRPSVCHRQISALDVHFRLDAGVTSHGVVRLCEI